MQLSSFKVVLAHKTKWSEYRDALKTEKLLIQYISQPKHILYSTMARIT